jgi:hypothetical protein
MLFSRALSRPTTIRPILSLYSTKTTTSAAPDPATTPTSIHGKPLQSWQQVHDQFKSRYPRDGLDTDSRDIGRYPALSTDYTQRDYRAAWDDKYMRRNWGEPVPEDFDVKGVFMVDRGDFKLWYMVATVAGFLSMFAGWWWVCRWYEERFCEPKKPHPFNTTKYSIRGAQQ